MLRSIHIISVLNFFLLTSQVNGQDSLSVADPKASKIILLHFDKESYYAGDTVFFKAYLYTDFNPDLSVTNLLIAFYNAAGIKITEQRYPVFGGCCYGNLALSDSAEHGLYYFQAITPEQLMRKDSIGYIRQVFVFNPKRVPPYLKESPKPEYVVQFFPQGGELVAGISNQVLFTATDQYGNPAPVKGKLLDDQQNMLTEFESPDGKGSFFLFPELKAYTASVSLPGYEKNQSFELPAVRSKGAVLRIEENGAGKKYLIEVSDSMDREGLTLLGEMNDKLVFQLPLKGAYNSFTGVIPASKLPSGILFLAVRNGQGGILAENHCQIDNGEYRKTAELVIDSLDLAEGGKNVLTIDLKDSIWAALSLSVTDPDITEPMLSIGSNIIEDAFFYNKHGKQKPDWKTIFADNAEQAPFIEDFINIAGKVYKEGTNKLIREGQLVFMVTTKDSANNFLFSTIDTSGSFQLNNLVFADTAKFGYVMTKPKGKGVGVSIQLDRPPYKMPGILPFSPVLPQLHFDKIFLGDTSQRNPLVARFDSVMKGADKYKLLEEAVVLATTRKRNPTLVVNEQYTSGLFSAMGMPKVMDLINDPPVGGGNIFDYISGKWAGVRVTRKNGFDYTVTTNRSPSLMSMMLGEQTETIFYLNEHQVAAAELTMIPLSDFALIKFFPPGTHQLGFSSLSPILAAYTKKDADSYQGYGIMNDFKFAGYNNSDLLSDDEYNQYHSGKTGCIYWKPDLLLAAENTKLTVRFVNPRHARSFHILLQGITGNGELIYLEKTISAK